MHVVRTCMLYSSRKQQHVMTSGFRLRWARFPHFRFLSPFITTHRPGRTALPHPLWKPVWWWILALHSTAGVLLKRLGRPHFPPSLPQATSLLTSNMPKDHLDFSPFSLVSPASPHTQRWVMPNTETTFSLSR